MKHLFQSIMIVFLCSSINAQQNSLAFLNRSDFDIIHTNKSRTINYSNAYLRHVAHHSTSKIVEALQKRVSEFKLKHNTIFDESEKATYRIIFNKKQGKAIVTYNTYGSIIASKEIYKNIKLPLKLNIKISRAYPEWALEKNSYSIHYIRDKETKVFYTVQINKGPLKKVLKFNGAYKLLD